jgi:hypothetical protein
MRLWQSRMCATFTVTVAPFSTRWHQTLKKRKTGKISQASTLKLKATSATRRWDLT